MAYAPTVNDMSGEILARYQLAGTQAMTQGIQSAASSIAGAGVAAGQKIEQNQQEAAMLEGKVNAYEQMGMMDAATLDKFNTGNLNTKRAIVSGLDATMFHQMKAHETGMDLAQLDISRQRVGLDEQRVMMDRETLERTAGWQDDAPQTIRLPGGGVGAIIRTGPNQRQYIPQGKADRRMPVPDHDPVVKGDMYWDPNTASYKPKPVPNFMNSLLGGGLPAPASAPAPAAAPAPSGGAPSGPRVGQRVRQGGKVYRFDGQNWIEE